MWPARGYAVEASYEARRLSCGRVDAIDASRRRPGTPATVPSGYSNSASASAVRDDGEYQTGFKPL